MRFISFQTLKKREHLPFIIFGIFFLIVQCFVVPYEGDDTYFLSTVTNSPSLFTFVHMRFMTWSGRLSSELLIGLFCHFNLWLWRLINTVIATCFIILISFIIKLPYLDKLSTHTNKHSVYVNSFVCLSFFIIPISVTTRACSWFTGSFYYLWPTLCCLLALLPSIKQVYHLPLNKRDYVIALCGTLYAGFMEQTGAVLLCFGLLTLLYLYLKQHKITLSLFIQIAVTAGCLVVYSLAPGNALRIVSETATWYPSFNELPLWHKLYQGMSWTHHHFVREQSFLLLALSLMLFVLLLPKVKTLLVKVICFMPSLYLIGMLLPFNQIATRTTSFEYHYDLEAVLNKLFFNPMEGILPSLISLIILLEIGILLYFALNLEANQYLCLTLYLAALASGYILGLSPTIFASGPRIFFLSDTFILLISGIVLGEFIERIKPASLLWQLTILIYSAFSGMMAIMYLGGIVAKSLFSIR